MVVFQTVGCAMMLFLAMFTPACAQSNTSPQTKKEMETSTNPRYTITVTQVGKELGKIEIELLPEVAPKHVAFFEARIAEGYYNGTAFHRVIPGFMIQGGDPNSISGPKNTWGTGGHPTKVQAEFNSTSHVRGIISAARTNDPNSFGGQFFICVGNPTFLDNQYTVFGKVISGMEVADVIVNNSRDASDNPLTKIEMKIEKK
jgi:peptidyl-prolyl cis-trans isomerase B (cyclophilin B)